MDFLFKFQFVNKSSSLTTGDLEGCWLEVSLAGKRVLKWHQWPDEALIFNLLTKI
jgi:hypothetical protein